MKINLFNEDIYFDEFPSDLQPEQKIFISNLLWLNDAVLPKSSIRVQIYTSLHLWNQILAYNLAYPKMIIANARFICIEPYKKVNLRFDSGHCMQLLMCDAPKDRSGNVMYLFKKNNKIEHFYAGTFTHIRYALLNDKVAKWLDLDVEKLYLSMQRAFEPMKTNENSIVATTIRELFSEKNTSKILFHVPLFGYESLVEHLIMEFPGIVGITGTYLAHYGLVVPVNNSINCLDKVKIMVISEELTMQQILSHYTKHGICCIKLTTSPPRKDLDELSSKALTELKYSVYPNAMMLDITCNATLPKYIFGIVNGEPSKEKVAGFLQSYVRLADKASMKNKEQSKKTNTSATKVSSSSEQKVEKAVAAHKQNEEKLSVENKEQSKKTNTSATKVSSSSKQQVEKAVATHKQSAQKSPEEVLKEIVYTIKKKQLNYLDENE